MSIALALPDNREVQMLRLAREIAMGFHDIETILKRYEIDTETWNVLKSNTYFQNVVRNETASWESANNTHERTKLKAAAAIEEWLFEAATRMHDPREVLSAKTEVAKLLTKIAGMGITHAEVSGGGERFSVTINLGASEQIKISKDVTPKAIEDSSGAL